MVEVVSYDAAIASLDHAKKRHLLLGNGFSIALKPPPSWGEFIPPAIGFLVFAILPYAEEIIRGLRAQKSGTVLWANTVPPPDA